MSIRRPPREWTRYTYHDAKDILVKLGAIEESLIGVAIDQEVLALRTRALRPYGERRQAALFLYGMGCLLQTSIAYAPVESADFDCVARWTEGDVTHHCPVQLKELPPETVTPLISLQSQIDKLAKYANSPDLCVAYYLNRNVRMTFDALVIPKLNLGSLWFNGGVSKTKIRWMLWGNLLDSSRQFEFEYPA